MFKPVRTPCVGICSTGIGDTVCRGCKRFAHEVIDWNAYDLEQRFTIAKRLETFLAQVVRNKIEVLDQALLLTQIKHQQIQFKEDQSPYCWVNDLLRAGASQITDLAVYGVQLQPAWKHVSLVAIKEAIDRDYYLLSSAHYDRYFAPGQVAEVAL